LSFADELRLAALPIWEDWHSHPFVRGIGDGTLAVEKFQHWLRQDYVYLKEYARVFALATAKARDLATMSMFARLLDGTLNSEMELHRRYAAQFGITGEELEHEPKSPTTQAYTDFLLAAAYGGDLDRLVAALLPCAWGFWEIGTRLAQAADAAGPGGRDGGGNPYLDWIATYSSTQFGELVVWLKDLMNRLAEGCSADRRRELIQVFVTSSRYELRFWDMAETLERLPVRP